MTGTTGRSAAKTMRAYRMIIPLMAAWLIAGCSSEVVSTAHRDLPEAGWDVTDTIVLPIEVNDTAMTYDLAITLRHTDKYPYQNIWFFMQTADGRRDTVLAMLADDRGQWLTTRAGRYYSGYVVAERNVRFDSTGIQEVRIVHGMRDERLQGVADVGIEVRRQTAALTDKR